ncbi:MAG: anti-sigma factor [Acidimicrobiales bacterium]|jgi:anti-sigma-K factor RskA
MTHDELEELLGVYALDALDAEERQAVDDHLLTCPRCRAELAAHREVAALLGNTADEGPAVAPDELWDRISVSLQEEPPALSPIARLGPGRRLALIVPLGAVAAALVLVVGLLAVKVANLDQKVTSLSREASVTGVLSNPSHQTIELTSATHPAWSATVVILKGQGYLINPAMPAIGRLQTFQLWALSSGKLVSLGVLGSNPSSAPLRVEANMTALMITAEPLGGTPVPTTPVLVRGNLPAGL